MTTGVAVPVPILQFFDNYGNPLSGGSLLTQVGGVNAATYSDSGLTTALPNPITLNSRGEVATSAGASVQMFLTPNTVYTFTLSDSGGNQIYQATYVNGVQLTGDQIAALTATVTDTPVIASYDRTAEEISASVTPSDYSYPFGDMRRYGIKGDGTDNTALFASIFGMFKTSGGTMLFQPGDYAGYIDLSGSSNAYVFVEGNGCTIRCYTTVPTNSTVVYCDNGGTGGYTTFTASNFTFRDVNFVARTYGSSTSGDVDYAAQFLGSSAKFYNCTFQYGKTAGYYSMYGQYSEFWSCEFNSCAASSTSAGCILDSHTTSGQSNEVLLSRCRFLSNEVALQTKGAFKTRINNCTFQGNGTSATGIIMLDEDSTNLGTDSTDITGCWFEDNSAPHIYEVLATGTYIANNIFTTSSGVNEITFAHCYDLTMIGNRSYNTMTCSISHPSANSDNARLTYWGNDFTPSTLAITHAGNTYYEGPPDLAQGSVQALTANGQTISHEDGAYQSVLISATAANTGLILQAGIYAGQVVAVINTSGYTQTMAASGTSNVADGTSCAIPTNIKYLFVWDGNNSLWYH